MLQRAGLTPETAAGPGRADEWLRACHNRRTEERVQTHGFLQYAVVLLLAAVIAVPLAKRWQLGAVLGYLAAGALIGPSGVAPDRQHRADQPDLRARRRADAVRDRPGAVAAAPVGHAPHGVRHRQPAARRDRGSRSAASRSRSASTGRGRSSSASASRFRRPRSTCRSSPSARSWPARTAGSASRSCCSRTSPRSRSSR